MKVKLFYKTGIVKYNESNVKYESGVKRWSAEYDYSHLIHCIFQRFASLISRLVYKYTLVACQVRGGLYDYLTPTAHIVIGFTIHDILVHFGS